MDFFSLPVDIWDFFFTKILPFVFVLTIVVFFHELGHFLVARWNKVNVVAFSVGFGPELAGFNDRQGTRWKVCAIPLGGYVKFLGDEDVASTTTDTEALEAMSAEERKGTFENADLWRKAAIVAAGPIANFILASVIYTGLFMHFGEGRLAPIVGKVIENSAALEAGIQVGDRIVSIDGQQITDFEQIGRRTYIGADTPLHFVVLRDRKEIEVVVTPRMTERKDQFGNTYQTGLVGIGPDTSPESFERVELGPLAAFSKSWDNIGLIITRTYHFLRELIAGKQDAGQLRGPLGIGQMTAQVATLGIWEILSLTAALSVSIGLMNLFPIPMLDGGHLVLYAIEAIRGKALSPKVQDMVFRVGISCILLMMLFVTTNDIMR